MTNSVSTTILDSVTPTVTTNLNQILIEILSGVKDAGGTSVQDVDRR